MAQMNNPTPTPTVINDSVHGHMELHPLLVKIIDTPQFQRLRDIKQLGGCYRVYPGASHNRFEHSIGVAYLAGELAKSLRSRQRELKIDDRDILCLQIAGLCHDLGHGPFSHLYDGMFIAQARRDLNWEHEEASLGMLDHMLENNAGLATMWGELLNEVDLVFIKELMTGEPLNQGNPNNPEDAWPFNGRTEEKSFLYEIVANKLNGIDVDKFDYFERDCHHLGIKNNFDHLRYFLFVRVCEVNRRKHICARDKELENLCGIFQTRNDLHRRAYQHNVNMNIQIMIKDAFVRADPHIRIPGTEFSLSQAIDDMEAYTKLTDHVFEKILYPDQNQEALQPASDILRRIVTRDLYKYLGHAKKNDQEEEEDKQKNDQEEEEDEQKKDKEEKDKKENDQEKEEIKKKAEMLENKLAAAIPEDNRKREMYNDYFEVSVVRFGSRNPLNNVFFFRKDTPDTAFPIPEAQVLRLFPQSFFEKHIRVYWKTGVKAQEEEARRIFMQWCGENGFTHSEE
ncbi:deoxynucleoside triphosphate triphosphohydrolase SAMHD1-like isoform 4-T4 [Menidia menidia]